VSEISSFQLLQPGWLLALPPLWVLLWLFANRNHRQSMWARLCDGPLLERMRAGAQVAGDRWLLCPLAIVSTLTVLAASGPSWQKQSYPLLETASARVIALDLSRAMLVEDVKPNRFAQARAAARELIGSNYDGETALLVYSGAAFVVSPLSRDADTLDAFVEALEPGMIPLEGLRADLAIERARELLAASASSNGRILLLASGAEKPELALRAAAAARADGLSVSILAIGSSAGGPMIETDGQLSRNADGGYRLAKTNFTDLERIAAAGGGAMISLTRAAADYFMEARIRAGLLAATEQGAEQRDRPAANGGYWLVWLALPFALLLFRRNLIWTLLVAILLPGIDDAAAAGSGSAWQHSERVAYDAYRRGDYELAGELSREPLLSGAAHYRRGQYQRALADFSRDGSAIAAYNRGNALVQLERLDEAISAYQQALELDPALDEARYNQRLLELFLEDGEDSDRDPSDEAGDEGSAFDPLQQAGSENQAGVAGEISGNPGDQQQPGPGLGASLQSGMIDPFEEFSSGEQAPERLAVMELLEQPREQRRLESWISELPVSSSELLRRKFLRDYQRQLRQPRCRPGRAACAWPGCCSRCRHRRLSPPPPT
jgi:Ca-activated chloride channel family protein